MAWNKEDIIEFRNLLGLDRSQFAKFLSVDTRSVIRWEKGLNKPTGTPEAILSGFREKIKKDPDSLPAIRNLISGSIEVGGLAYLIVKILDLMKIGEEGRGW